jgi:MFS family permease
VRNANTTRLVLQRSRRARFRAVLTGFPALAIVAAELAIMFFGATLPTPLYPLYRLAFGFGGITLTLIYAVYVLGNLMALLFFGRLSDQIGRRPATLPAIGVALVSTLSFLLADGTVWLFAARIVSGFATGLAAAAATTWLAELHPQGDKAVAASIASAANFAGLAAAPLLAGALAQFAPRPLRLPYVIYLLMLIGIGLAIFGPPETVKSRTRRLADLSLQPRLGVPKEIRLAFLSPAVTAFATFALIGFYAALIPSLLNENLQQRSPLVAGAVVFALFVIATATAATTSKLQSRFAMLSGLALLPPSLMLLVAAELLRSMPLLLLATMLGGIAAALGYRGSLEVVNRIAPSDKRSEVVSSYLIAVYLGNSLPIIGIGLLSDMVSSLAAHIAFAVGIGLLAAVAFATGMKYAPRQ